MRVLFVCKHNRFRSKVAEAFFNKYNENSENKARSRGIIKDIDTSENVVKVLRENGIKLRNKKSIQVSETDLNWADLIIIVADNVKKSDLKSDKKIIIWKISDTSQDDIKGIRKRVKIIEKKILNLLKKLKNQS